MSDPEGKEVRKAKHMSLVDALRKVKKAKRDLQKLFDEVMGICEPPKDPLATAETKCSLVSVLNSTGNEIIEIAEQIICLTIDLRKEIL